MSKITLFCFPYAGGSAYSTYFNFKFDLSEKIELYPVELKGRGRRFSEKHYKNSGELLEDMMGQIKGKIKEQPYAFWGHSMGARVAYHLASKIIEMDFPRPLHLFLSGALPPGEIGRDESWELNDDLFLEEVIKIGGMPKEILENKELLGVFLPIIRNDFKVLNDLNKQIVNTPLPIDLSIIYGSEELSIKQKLKEWERHSNQAVNFQEYPGNHFFIKNHVEGLSRLINSKIAEVGVINENK
ncbi:thioesterase [Bacillus cereus]|uniref:Thioesterase n=1 Tax=Bacillus cereus TaxID=1396 RepID=A0A9W7Q300_BACCE|nr:thioesterase domain-containing protein [Bacillus cereus]KAA6459461.1 thioesterase [Bacillus cereus]KAB2502431.1 thioesterase [Bacillus cereus]